MNVRPSIDDSSMSCTLSKNVGRRGRSIFFGIVAAYLAFWGSAASARDPLPFEWTIDNAAWDNEFTKDPFSSAGQCGTTAIAQWHVRWPGHNDAIFTLTEATPNKFSWQISNNASGGFACSRKIPAAPELASGSNSCKKPAGATTPNPIIPASGSKYRSEVDWIDGGPAPLEFVRTYQSSWSNAPLAQAAGLGLTWNHKYNIFLNVSVRNAAGNAVAAEVTLPDGYARTFYKPSGSSLWKASNGSDTLIEGGIAPWTYHRGDDDSTLTFDASGKLQISIARNGWATAFFYNGAGQLATVQNMFGRAMNLAYDASGRLAFITTPDGRIIAYGYDGNGRLMSITYPDGRVRAFAYENASLPFALTGIYGEDGMRWGTFAYDTVGRATASELAGGVEHYQISYPAANSAAVVDPLGTSRTFTYGVAAGKLAVTGGGGLPAGSGEPDAASRVQDANGLVTSETDFKGAKTTTTWNVTRRLPLTVTRAAGTSDAQVATAEWHATLELPTLITEAGRTTTFTYDNVGNVLSKAVTDTKASPNTTRTWSWTYNAQQLVATATEPNSAVTTYEYDTLGNLTKSTNALGHVTQYGYDTANRIVSETAPNGLVTTYTYDARDRVLTRTVGGQQTTTLTYKPYGKVETITLPTGLVLTYTYDAAHRLTGWSNNRGEQGSFTLDGMGNRTAEQIKDSSGAIAWTAARTVNNINRLSSSTEGPNQTSTFGYDANGERTSETSGLNESTRYGLDNLRRVSSITNPANATATLAWNALDAVTQAKDFKGVATNYTRDAQGNATAETSADIGSRGTQYDALGLPSTLIDALGQATQIQRDLLGRPTSLSFADGKTTTLRYDLTPQSTGYLSEITDRSGVTEYTRDAFGRVTAKRQTLASGLVQQIGYGYAANGQLVAISYPNGGTLTQVYDTTGRLVQLNWNGAPLVTGLTWNPLGQPTAWVWALGTPVAAARSYDTAGRLTATEFSGYVYNAAGRITSLSQYLYQPADTDPTHTTIAGVLQGWNVGYDSVGRITAFDAMGAGGIASGFGYDANGNRSSSTGTINGQTTSRTYTVDGTSNKLTGFGQTSGGTSTSVAYTYNANGDLLSDGLRTYAYNAEGRLSAATTGAKDTSPTTRYAHNALGQRVFKTEPLYPPSEGDESDPGFFQSLINFFTSLWAPSTSDAEKLGWAYVYDEDGSLIAETGTGGANSTGSTVHIYLPTASGPMPIAAIVNGQKYAVHSDHLNTPRRLTDDSGQPVWQWSYSAFGDEQPTTAASRFGAAGAGTTGATPVAFNLRYPGQVADVESGLNYNYFRSYSPTSGRYTEADPIGLDGGWNRFSYVEGNPLSSADPLGLQAQNYRAVPPNGASYASGIAAARVSSLSSEIRRFDSNFQYSTIAPRGYTYNRQDVEFLTDLLRQYERSEVCTANGLPRPTINYGSTPNGLPFTRHYGTETGPVRRLPGSVLDETIANGAQSSGRNGTTIYYDPVNNVTVVTGNGGIASAHQGPPK